MLRSSSSEIAMAVCAVSILLIPFAWAGLTLINAGLGRSRSAAHSMLSSLCVVSVAALAYFVCGFAWQGFAGGPAYQFTLAGQGWNWIAAELFFFRRLPLDGSPGSLAAIFGMLSVGLSALIPLGTGSDRWRLASISGSTALLAGFTFPIFAHWTWGGGWLAQLGANAGLGHGFVDPGGSGTIHAVGGLTALSLAWILGPRRGKYTVEGMPSAIPGHSSVLVMLGCIFCLIGWSGLNVAGAILFAGVQPGSAVLIEVNTALAAMSSCLTGLLITQARFGKPDASLSANSWVGGLVAISAGCGFVAPASAVLIDIVAGALVTCSVEWIELSLGVDDPTGAISAHGIGGIWGILAVAIFARIPVATLPLSAGLTINHAGVSDSGQWVAQVVGVATLLGFVLPVTYCLNRVLNRFSSQRVGLEGERQGMDLYELGAGAYPEFLIHNEEFTQRKI
jgi:ammonium transporter, Amt family